MKTASSIRLNDTTTSLHVQRAALAPTNRELGLLLRSKFDRDMDSFKANELALARVVFAQVALMAGAALVADSEMFVGADQLWRDMQDRIGPQERALAKHFLDILSTDEYYSQSERGLIGALAAAMVETEEPPVRIRSESGQQADPGARTHASEESKTQYFAARSSIRLDDASTSLLVQRASLAPSNREIANLVQAKFGRGLDSFKANELALARVVFAQVTLMAGAALTADSETFAGAEELWRDMLEGINPRERALAKHFLDLLSSDEYYSESERQLIGALSAALVNTEDQSLGGAPDCDTQRDWSARFYAN